MKIKTMTIDFKSLAVEFVRLNDCAMNVPVELVEKAMTIGAAEMALMASDLVAGTTDNMKANRLKNQGSHSGFSKTIQVDEP